MGDQGYMDAAAVPVPDAGDDTLREMARTVTAHVRLGVTTRCSCGEIWHPLHVATALMPAIRAHVAAAVQAERERAKLTTDTLRSYAEARGKSTSEAVRLTAEGVLQILDRKATP